MPGQERWMKPEVGSDGVMCLWLASLARDVESALQLERSNLSDKHDFLQDAHDLRPELLRAVGEAWCEGGGQWSSRKEHIIV
jgi:hypothetical protein